MAGYSELDHGNELRPGTIVDGRYRVLSKIGYGAMGIVYRCENTAIQDDKVAMKVLHRDAATDPIVYSLFRSEVLSLYQISDANVIRAFDFIDRTPFVAFTMEYIDGDDLWTVISRHQQCTLFETLEILSQVSKGVRAIHRAGFVHRDLKPENIFISRGGEIKVGDFGVACTVSSEYQEKENEDRQIVGTAEYISPEYLMDGILTHQVDLFALGVIGFEVVTGRIPQRGENPFSSMAEVLSKIESTPHSQNQSIPDFVAAAIAKLLEVNPAERTPDIDTFLASLSAAISSLSNAGIWPAMPLQRILSQLGIEQTNAGHQRSDTAPM